MNGRASPWPGAGLPPTNTKFPFTVAPHERRLDALSNVEFQQRPGHVALK